MTAAVKGIKNLSNLTPHEVDMGDLIRRSLNPGRKDALTACFLLTHGELLREFPKEGERREYLSTLYDKMRALEERPVRKTRLHLLVPPSPTRTQSHRQAVAVASRPRPVTVDSLDERIRNLGKATIKRILGHDLSSPNLGGRLIYTATFEEGERVRIRVEENSLRGVSDEKREAVERAIEEIEYRLPRPRVGMTEMRTYTVSFSPGR